MPTQEADSRNVEFKRNDQLEDLLNSLNDSLSLAENNILETNNYQQKHPVIFIMGAHRSGTTLLLQWLASLGIFSYPTNLLSRFYAAPIIGAKIQKMLVDEEYNFRNEFEEINKNFDFSSDNGKTRGLLAPNEFWYFWRQYLNYTDLDYMSDDELEKTFDKSKFRNELFGVMTELKKPLALKAMIMNYNIPFLDKMFDHALFIHVKRDKLSNVESMITARERQHGDKNTWYSFKIKEYPSLKEKDYISQCTGQYYHINKAIDDGLTDIDESRKLVINYEDFCADPLATYTSLTKRLGQQNFTIDDQYTGQNAFETTRYGETDNTRRIISAYDEFLS